MQKLSDVDKPGVSGLPVVTALLQPEIPAEWDGKELPYAEARPAPEPTAHETARGFILFARPITRAIYGGSVPAAEERIEQRRAFAAPGQYEPVSFSVYSLRDIRNLRVLLSELRSGKDRIGAGQFDLRLVTEWPMRYPHYTSSTCRRVPELREKVTVNSFAAGISRRYWISVHVPEDARPGLYSGTATVFE